GIGTFVDLALVDPPDTVQGPLALSTTTRIAEPPAEHRCDAQVTALIRRALNSWLPRARGKKFGPFPHTFGDEALPGPLQGVADQRGQPLESSAGGDRQFGLCPAHDPTRTAENSAHPGKRRVVRRQDV